MSKQDVDYTKEYSMEDWPYYAVKSVNRFGLTIAGLHTMTWKQCLEQMKCNPQFIFAGFHDDVEPHLWMISSSSSKEHYTWEDLQKKGYVKDKNKSSKK